MAPSLEFGRAHGHLARRRIFELASAATILIVVRPRTRHTTPRAISPTTGRARDMATFDDVPDDDGLFTVVRPTRWKSRDDGATVDPDLLDDELDTTSYTLGPDTPSPAKDDDDDHVELGMDDISAEWAEPPGEDEAALGHLLASAERALESVRRKGSPAKPEPLPLSPTEPERSESEHETEHEHDSDSEHEPESESEHDSESEGPVFAPPARPSRAPSASSSPSRSSRGTLAPPPRVGASARPRVVASSSSNASARAAKAKDWIAESASLRAKRRLAERAAHPTGVKLPDPDLEAHARLGAASAEAERKTLREDLLARLGRVRGGVSALASRVADARRGDARASELGGLMETAERDIVALREAQRSAFDALLREEKDLSRFVDDFARRLDAWDADKSDPVWADLGPDGARKITGRRAYGSDRRRPSTARDGTATGAVEPWSRGSPRSTTTTKTRSNPRADDDESTFSSPSSRGERSRRPATAGPGPGPGPWARGANTTSARTVPRLAIGAAAAAAAKPPPAVTAHDDFVEEYGTTGGWADVDHARWRRCLARCNMNYGAATVMAAEELAAFGVERAEVVRHARWDAEREELLRKKKAAVRAWREKQRDEAAAQREAADAEMRAEEEARKQKAAAAAAAAREREKAALREWKARKREEEANAAEARAADAEAEKAARVERARELKRERAERDARNAVRAQARWEMQEAARAAAEAAAEALIPSAPKQTAAEAKAERDRLAARALESATRRREAAAAKNEALRAREARQKAAAEKLRERRRLAEGKTSDLSDPHRLTRATASHALRVASEREVKSMFDAAPAVQYLQHRATPAWRAMR